MQSSTVLITVMIEGMLAENDIQLALYNVSGQLMMTHNLPGPGRHYIDLTALPDGLYFYKAIQNGQQLQQGKLVKQ